MKDIQSIEKKILKKLLANPDYLKKYIHRLNSNDFTLATIKNIIKCFEENPTSINHYVPSKEFFSILLRKYYRDEQELFKASVLLSSIANNDEDPKDLEILIKELKSNRFCKEVSMVIKKNIDLIKPDTIDMAYENLIKELLDITTNVNNSAFIAKIKEINSSVEERALDYLQPKKDKIPTNIKAFDCVMGGFEKGELVTISAGTGQGKCLKVGTKVLKYNGEIVPVESIAVGDLLMGPDSKPRKVLGTTKGVGQMYRIVPTYGNPWECNEDHILTLKHRDTNEIVDISIKDYFKQSKLFKRKHAQFFTQVNFDEHKLKIDPYLIGLIICSEFNYLSNYILIPHNSKLVSYMHYTCSQYKFMLEVLYVNEKKYFKISSRLDNEYWQEIKNLISKDGELSIKCITSSEQDRTSILSAIVDISSSVTNYRIKLNLNNEKTAKSIVFISRSLGFGINDPKYCESTGKYKLLLKGKLKRLKTLIKEIKDYIVSEDIDKIDFKIEDAGVGEYAGFNLDGDGRFLMGDFIVTHNSNIMLWWAEQMVENDMNCIYVTIEMSTEANLNRYHAIQTGFSTIDIANKTIPSERVKEYLAKLTAAVKTKTARKALIYEALSAPINDIEEYVLYLNKISTKYVNRKGKLYIIDIESCTPSRIDQEIQKLAIDTNIDCVFIDFINVTEANIPNRDRARELGFIAREFKRLARKHNILVFTAAQLDTTSLNDENKEITPDKIKYSRAIAENSDWVIAFHRTPEEMLNKQLRLQLIKHRHSSGCTALIEFDFNTMQAKDLGFADGSFIPTGYSKAAIKHDMTYASRIVSEVEKNEEFDLNQVEKEVKQESIKSIFQNGKMQKIENKSIEDNSANEGYIEIDL